eukprot:31496-Pelagococcus_subviridis.AAC.4
MKDNTRFAPSTRDRSCVRVVVAASHSATARRADPRTTNTSSRRVASSRGGRAPTDPSVDRRRQSLVVY